MTLFPSLPSFFPALSLAKSSPISIFFSHAPLSERLEQATLYITVEALESDHLGSSEKWSQLELVAYEDGLS